MNLADVKAHLDELVDRAEAGESIEIMRDGRPVARLAPIENSTRPTQAPRKKVDVDALRRLTDSLPPQTEGIVREMRDSARY
jgi:prevent-host-death family protein